MDGRLSVQPHQRASLCTHHHPHTNYTNQHQTHHPTTSNQAYESRILPALRRFQPELLLISTGFDAHADDPLGELELSPEDFHWVTARCVCVDGRWLVGVVERECGCVWMGVVLVVVCVCVCAGFT